MSQRKKPVLKLGLLGTLFLLASCSGDDPVGPGEGEVDFVSEVDVRLNPSGVAPLTARVSFTTSRAVSVAVTVPGRNGPATDVRHHFTDVGQTFDLPVLGLYPNSDNNVVLTFFDGSGAELGSKTFSVTTAPLISDLPQITIDAATPSAMKPGFNLVSYFGHDSELNPQRAFIFDNAGQIRWYLDFSDHPQLSRLFYDNGMERLANGNLYFGDGNTERIYEINMLGEIVNQWEMPGYGFHHNVIEKPNGNFVVTVNRQGAPTTEDVLIEIDRTSGEIVNTWDLNASLEYGRRAWTTAFADTNVDWFHGNAVVYDETDDTIIVSGRTQGTVKLTSDNQVVWILAPHKDWGTAGNGANLQDVLLQPLDADRQPITDAAVLEGDAPHPDFEWAWYQHAPLLLPDGTLMLFDNGDNRHYVNDPLYSRAVAYRIDEAAGTIQQVWQYGKERGRETFARIVSDVDYHEEEQNVLFMPGAVRFQGATYGKVIEVDYDSKEVVFEATITPPTAGFGIITFHRVERLPLYPPNL